MNQVKKKKINIQIWTDGSVHAKSKIGAYGWVIAKRVAVDESTTKNEILEIDTRASHNTTITEMEILGALEACKRLKNKFSSIARVNGTLDDYETKITVFVDSKIVVESFNTYISGWIKNAKNGVWITSGGKPVKNQEQLQMLYDMRNVFSELRLVHVTAHQNNDNLNDMIDKHVRERCALEVTATNG